MEHKRFADMTPAERRAVRAARQAEWDERTRRALEHAEQNPVSDEERAELDKIFEKGL